MKIISGELGGRLIPGRSSRSMRPTSDKVREAIFDILSARFVDDWTPMEVLDLFAGSGGLGLEALSRGAKFAVFNDHHPATIKQLSQTLESFELTKKTEVHCRGALEFLRWLNRRGDRFDLIFLDPPYHEGWILGVLNLLVELDLLRSDGLVIAEHDKRELLTATEGFWKIEDARRYGDTMVSFLRRMDT